MDIKPCPFCGNTEIEFRDQTHWTGQRSVVLSVELIHRCPDNGFITSITKIRAKTKDEVVQQWNKRT